MGVFFFSFFSKIPPPMGFFTLCTYNTSQSTYENSQALNCELPSIGGYHPLGYRELTTIISWMGKALP